jgi:transcriptional regulator with PAS, ATPase and Fis domain
MAEVFRLLQSAATSPIPVLIEGETGTGKELVARSIHAAGPRADEPFVAVNCAALPETLLESELFGYEKGAFTGAVGRKEGRFELAHGGTLFLDEVADLSLVTQPKILRVLQEGEFERLGGTRTLKVDVRIVAATNRPIEQAVAANKLREDLLYRLNIFTLRLPPLRQRGDDVELLAKHFLGELNAGEGTLKQFARGCLEPLRRHHWPGNVRELKNVIQRAFVLAGEGAVISSLPLEVGVGVEPAAASRLVVPVGAPLTEMERQVILATLDHFDGDKKKVASALKISMKTLYARLREYKTP